MLELGLAMSHAPTMFAPLDQWRSIHDRLVQDVPPPPGFQDETQEVLVSHAQRINDAIDELRRVLNDVHPDLLVIVGDDQNEVFGPAIVPNLAVFVGDETHGTTNLAAIGQSVAENHITLKSHTEFANYLAMELTERGFYPAVVSELQAAGRPEVGLGHAFTRPANVLGLTETGIPVVVVFHNSSRPPLPSGQRCFELGEAIRDIASSSPERVALLASGGLAHNPRGRNAGWLDEKLDRWVLDQIANGRGDRLANLFSFDSQTLEGGTGEIRSWIIAAAAFAKTRATIIDYVPSIHAITGLGFAYWRP